jgi:hypothetical protein
VSLAYKPHTASVQTASQRVVGNNVEGRGLATAADVACQITPGNSKLIFEQHNIELESPYLLMCDIGDAPKFTVGSVVSWSGKTFAVEVVEPWNAIPAISFASVILKETKPA